MIILIFVIGILIYLFTIVKQKFSLSKYDSLMPGPPTLPLIGNGLEFIGAGSEKINAKLNEYLIQYGERFRFRLGPDYIIVVANPSDIEAIFNSPKALEKGGDYYFLTEWLKRGLLLSHGEKWFQRRKLLTHAFHFKILEDYVRIFNTQADVFVEHLRQFSHGQPFEISQYASQFALDVICETAMGIKLNSLFTAESEYSENIKEALQIYHERVYHMLERYDWYWNLTSKSKRFTILANRINGFVNAVIRRKRDVLEKDVAASQNTYSVDDDDDGVGIKKRHAFLDLLLKAELNEKPLTDEDINEEVNNFMFAGHDTTATTITFMLYALARHPSVQEKVFDEIKHVMGDKKDEPLTLQKLNELKYMDLVLKEVLRMYSPVPLIARYISEDLELNGKFYPAGSRVFILIQQMHKNSKYFPEPEQFIPERHEELKTSKDSFAYIPFSAGFRGCIGQKFAQYDIKTCMTKFLSSYKITLKENFKPNITANVVIYSSNGIWLKMTNRKY